jgi:hypothetical protein
MSPILTRIPYSKGLGSRTSIAVSVSSIPIISNGLILYLDAGNAASYPGSGTTWTDVSGNINTGTLIDGPIYTSGTPSYFTFDGTNDYVLANNTNLNSLSLTSRFSNTSVSHFSWVYPTGAGVLVAELGQTAPNSGWHDSNIEISAGGAFSFSTWHNGLTSKVVSTNQLFNIWYYVGFTYDGTTLTAYINGSSIGTTTFTRTAPSQTHYALFAADFTNMGTGGQGIGRCASFSVYNRALSASEVLQNYNSLKDRFDLSVTSGLILYLDAGNAASYPGSGTTWTDLSGNSNTGTLTNGPTYSSANGGSIVFDGTNDFVDVPHNTLLDPTLNMTVSSWVNMTSFKDSNSIFGKGAGAAGFDFRIDSSTQLNLVKYAVVDQRITVAALSTGTWYNIAAVQSATKVDYYINGSFVGSFSNSSAYITVATSLKIGKDRNTIFTAAKIPQVSMYNRQLSAAEIQQNWLANKSRFGY